MILSMIMLYYKTNNYKGKIKSSKEGEVFWIKREDIDSYELSLDLKRILKIMEDDNLSELIYYHDSNGKYRSKIV